MLGHSLWPGCLFCSARACRRDGVHTDTVHPPFKPRAAITFSLVDSLERAETLSALFFSTPNVAGNKINKIIFAPSGCPLRDRFTMSGPGKPSGLMLQWYPQLTPPRSWDLTKPTATWMSLQASEYSLVNLSFFSTLQSLYPLPPPNILIETQGSLEVKGPHPVSSVCPLHSTDGETEAQRGCALPRVIQ